MEIIKGTNKKLLLIVNPVAGKGRGRSALFDAISALSAFGYRVSVMLTEPIGNEQKIALESFEYEKIVAIGGDGTLNCVVNGILNGNKDAVLGYIPLGSANDFAASLKLPTKIITACEKIAHGEPRGIDVGRFGDRYFTYIACCGMFSSASYTTPQPLKNRLGFGAYLLQGINSIKDIHPIRYTVETESETIVGSFLFASVSSTTRVGGVVRMPKGVVFDDGFFELTMIKPPETLAEGGTLINDLIASRLETENFLRRKVRRANIIAETPVRWSIDGESGGSHESVSIDVARQALRFVY